MIKIIVVEHIYRTQFLLGNVFQNFQSFLIHSCTNHHLCHTHTSRVEMRCYGHTLGYFHATICCPQGRVHAVGAVFAEQLLVDFQ